MTGRRAHGFSVIELMMAMALMTALMAAVFSLVASSRRLFETQPELQDLQQRLRVATATLERALLHAGAGSRLGPARGPLSLVTAPILPYRFPTDVSSDRSPRSDAISMTYLTNEAAQTNVRAIVAGGASIQVAPNCGPRRPGDICGFQAGMPVMLFDAAGHVSYGVVSALDGEFVQVDGDGRAGRVDVEAGAVLAGVERHHYWLEPARGASPPRLMHFDGDDTSATVVDHVVGLRFEYFADPSPPTLSELVAPGNALRSSYGPPPPPIGHDDPRDEWGAGENCVFVDAGGHQVSRLPALSSSHTPVVLTPAEMADGPWCPDGQDPYRFDADLLRVRRVTIVIRVEAADAGLRGPAGPLFARAGTAVRGFLPDREIRFDVAPRNASLPVIGP
jgi:type II secretory pathway pseudopilin PulG